MALFLNLFFTFKCQSQNVGTKLSDTSFTFKKSKSNRKVIQNISNNHHLVNLFNIIPLLKTAFYYASVNNFTGQKLYINPKPYLVEPAAFALKNVADSLEKIGLGIILYDAYRPHNVSVKMWEIVNNPNFVADPSKGSNHNRGTAVDLSLYNLATGNALKMPTGFDDFTEKAHLNYKQLSKEKITNRELLKNIMIHFGFKPYEYEWWHYTFITDKKYDVLNYDFSELQN